VQDFARLQRALVFSLWLYNKAYFPQICGC